MPCAVSQIAPIERLQLPEETQPHLTHAFRLISKDLTNQLSKRLGIPNARLQKQHKLFSPCIVTQEEKKVYAPNWLLNIPSRFSRPQGIGT